MTFLDKGWRDCSRPAGTVTRQPRPTCTTSMRLMSREMLTGMTRVVQSDTWPSIISNRFVWVLVLLLLSCSYCPPVQDMLDEAYEYAQRCTQEFADAREEDKSLLKDEAPRNTARTCAYMYRKSPCTRASAASPISLCAITVGMKTIYHARPVFQAPTGLKVVTLDVSQVDIGPYVA